jgi:hypothetical protein
VEKSMRCFMFRLKISGSVVNHPPFFHGAKKVIWLVPNVIQKVLINRKDIVVLSFGLDWNFYGVAFVNSSVFNITQNVGPCSKTKSKLSTIFVAYIIPFKTLHFYFHGTISLVNIKSARVINIGMHFIIWIEMKIQWGNDNFSLTFRMNVSDNSVSVYWH